MIKLWYANLYARITHVRYRLFFNDVNATAWEDSFPTLSKALILISYFYRVCHPDMAFSLSLSNCSGFELI